MRSCRAVERQCLLNAGGSSVRECHGKKETLIPNPSSQEQKTASPNTGAVGLWLHSLGDRKMNTRQHWIVYCLINGRCDHGASDTELAAARAQLQLAGEILLAMLSARFTQGGS